jgi:hypothetical protein
LVYVRGRIFTPPLAPLVQVDSLTVGDLIRYDVEAVVYDRMATGGEGLLGRSFLDDSQIPRQPLEYRAISQKDYPHV